jgi:hypothetical protein
MIPQQLRTEVESAFEMLEANSRVAELEAEIAQLKDALAKRQQIGVATGLLAQRFAITPERAWSLLVRLSQNCHVKVRDIAQAMINAHCGRLSPADADILSSIEMHLPGGVPPIGSCLDGQHPSKESPQ